ncbi:hypothetical protein XF_0023 [Xylella fastidiosa 9a5c]|uniref:Uncharacterized protein n=1 Tax=Xylella fastidiosa (strain 9a5c) TaxID=160492 RepID=Q9PHC1_XYLFA|nr:hypothetical protein XF_0023 [Xylella fastidiosa 9a5c]
MGCGISDFQSGYFDLNAGACMTEPRNLWSRR